MARRSESEPVLRIKYYPGSRRSSLGNLQTEELFQENWSNNCKIVSLFKRDFLRLIHSWNILIPTHYVTYVSSSQQAASLTLDEAGDWDLSRNRGPSRTCRPGNHVSSALFGQIANYCASLSIARQAYRERIASGMQKVAAILGNNEENIHRIMILFEPYPGVRGQPWMTDQKLVQCVREEMPEWMLDSVAYLGGIIEEEELDAWDVE